MKDLLTFAPGDVCFGKVRGFPAWPARVVALAEESSVKQCKYHVSFFGTGESGLLKADEMHSYFANKIKFTKNVKRKGFQAGLQEIEQYILENNLTPAEGELDSTPAEILISDVETPGSEKPKVQKTTQKRPALKRLSEPLEKRPRPSLEPTPTSRSGRKIRPKKFSDEFEDEEPFPPGDASDEEPPTKVAEAVVEEAEKAEDLEEIGAELAPVDSTKVLHLNFEPATENTPTALPAPGKKSVRGAKDKAREEEIKEKRKGKLMLVNWFRIEKRLIELDIVIRLSLGLNKHDLERAMPALDELGTMILDPLMLKKHPQIVETVKKLRSYIGNSPCWDLSEEEEHIFPQKSEQIRNKAQLVYNRLKTLFVIPQHASFWQVFSDHVEEFTRRTQDWDRQSMYELTHEPTDEDCLKVKKGKLKSKNVEATNGIEINLSVKESPSNKEEIHPEAEESAMDVV